MEVVVGLYELKNTACKRDWENSEKIVEEELKVKEGGADWLFGILWAKIVAAVSETEGS